MPESADSRRAGWIRKDVRELIFANSSGGLLRDLYIRWTDLGCSTAQLPVRRPSTPIAYG